MKNLAKPCRGTPRRTDYGHAVLERVASGRHPNEPFKAPKSGHCVVESHVTRGPSHVFLANKGANIVRRPAVGSYLESVYAKLRSRFV